MAKDRGKVPLDASENRQLLGDSQSSKAPLMCTLCPTRARNHSLPFRETDPKPINKESPDILSQTIGPMLMIISSYDAVPSDEVGFTGRLSKSYYQ